MFVLWFRVPVAPVLGCASVQPQSVSVNCLLGFYFNSIAEILPKKKKTLTCRSRYHMQPQLQWHKIINMMGLQDAMTLTRKLIISWRKKQTSQWTNLPLLSFHFYKHQLVQMLLNLKFHTSQCSLQNCATYTCRVVNQQIN